MQLLARGTGKSVDWGSGTSCNFGCFPALSSVSSGLTLCFQSQLCAGPRGGGAELSALSHEAIARGALYDEGTSRDKKAFLPLVLSLNGFLEEKTNNYFSWVFSCSEVSVNNKCGAPQKVPVVCSP